MGLQRAAEPVPFRPMEVIVKHLFLSAAGIALLLGATETKAAELPTYHVFGFPITAHQMSVLTSARIQERSPAPALMRGGMPASPHQLLVLAPRPKIGEQAAATKLIGVEFSSH